MKIVKTVLWLLLLPLTLVTGPFCILFMIPIVMKIRDVWKPGSYKAWNERTSAFRVRVAP